jgi:flotillin
MTDQAGPLVSAQERQKVVIAEVKIEEERARAQIGVEQQTIEREKKSQEAIIVVPAKAKADAEVREAEGYKQAAIARSEGDKAATIAHADAEQHKRSAEGLGQGDAIKATGLAEAEVIERQGLAKAVAVSELAKAYQEFNEAAITLEVLKVLPQIVEALGTVFGEIAKPMASIDKLVVVDSGDGEGKGALQRFNRTGPLMFFQLIEQAKAAGIDLTPLIDKLGIKLGDSASADDGK